MSDLSPDRFVVDLDGSRGRSISARARRAQKVDLSRISILALADQFLAYLEEARARVLSLAAEYL